MKRLDDSTSRRIKPKGWVQATRFRPEGLRHVQKQRREGTPRLLEPIRDPIRLYWNEVTEVVNYYLSVNAMTKPMHVGEDTPPYGGTT